MREDEFRTEVFTGRTEATRFCIDPWSLLLIKANGDVHPCCHSQPVGSILTQELEDITNGKQLAEYRTGLFTGELTVSCRYCPARRKCSIEELRSALEKYQKTGEKVL